MLELLAKLIGIAIEAAITHGQEQGMTREQTLEALRVSQALASTLDQSEWAELARRGDAK